MSTGVSSASEIDALLAAPDPTPIPNLQQSSCWSWKDIVLIPSEALAAGGITYSAIAGQWWYVGGCALVELGLFIGHYASYRQFADQRQVASDLHSTSVDLQATASKTRTGLRAINAINGQLQQSLDTQIRLVQAQEASLRTYIFQTQNLQTENRGLTAQIEVLKSISHQMVPYLQNLNESTTQTQITLKQVNSDVVDLTQIHAHLSKTIDESGAKQQQLVKALEEIQTIHASMLERLDKEITLGAQEVRQLSGSVGELQGVSRDLQTKKAELEALQTQLTGLKQTVQTELQTLEQTKKAREEVRASIHEETKALKSIQIELQTYYNSLETPAQKGDENI